MDEFGNDQCLKLLYFFEFIFLFGLGIFLRLRFPSIFILTVPTQIVLNQKGNKCNNYVQFSKIYQNFIQRIFL